LVAISPGMAQLNQNHLQVREQTLRNFIHTVKANVAEKFSGQLCIVRR